MASAAASLALAACIPSAAATLGVVEKERGEGGGGCGGRGGLKPSKKGENGSLVMSRAILLLRERRETHHIEQYTLRAYTTHLF